MKTIFIDRDGVINRDRVDYVKTWDEWIWIDGAIKAVVRLKQAGWTVVIFTNQSCIRRNIASAETIQAINDRMTDIFAQAGAKIDGVYVCPHGNRDKCHCRKPKPGLILDAARDLDLDVAQAVVVGDASRDILAGQAAKAGQTVLVRTGKGVETEKDPAIKPDHVFDDLSALVDFLLK